MRLFQRQFPEESKKVQQERLVNRDFPWLWAVRSHWFFPSEDIRIIYPDRYLTNLLWNKCSAEREIWVHCGYNGLTYANSEVVRVKANPRLFWVEAIHLACLDRGTTHIVVVNPILRENGSERTVNVTVYRPRKPETSFDDFIGVILEEVRQLLKQIRR